MAERVVSAAAIAFDQTLEEIGAELSPEAGRRAALTAAADMLWESHLGPMYDTAQVCELLGNVTRQAVNQRVQRGALLALGQENGEYRYPAFQFSKRGQPKRRW